MRVRTARRVGLAVLFVCMSAANMASPQAGERAPRPGGFSEVHVPQVRGNVPAAAADMKETPDSKPETEDGAGDGASGTASTTAPKSCTQENAESQACYTAVQQAPPSGN